MTTPSDPPSEPNRRGFLRQGMGLATAVGLTVSSVAGGDDRKAGADLLRKFLESCVLKKQTLDRFLDPRAQVWAKFDPELGYLLRNACLRDGVDGCHTLQRYETTGQRKQVNFTDQPCRINTYGDSFTQGAQVSDGETWQEVLAAHFCEPIRNFGIGGYGVYQAYRRLLRTEPTELGAKYLIFNIWGDDHYRSIYAWRWMSFPPNTFAARSDVLFHANPWVHARLDPATGELVEKPNPCPDAKTLYKLCDPEFVFDRFQQDEVTHALLAGREGVVADRTVLEKMAATLQVKELDLGSPDAVQKTANRLLHTYAVRVGMKLMEKLSQFCAKHEKKLLVLLSYPGSAVAHACSDTPPGAAGNVDWHPQVFKEHLAAHKVPFVDTLPKHVAEFKTFRLTPKEYVGRYYIGHYNPKGNHFFAYAIKDELLAWLDPKPPTYQNEKELRIHFKGYLPG